MGGTLPNERIPALRPGFLREFTKRERGLAGDVPAASPEARRAPAHWVARRTPERAELTGVGWIADGLRAPEEGRPLPPPFDNGKSACDRLLSDPAVPQAMAFPAIFGAAEEEALSRTPAAAAVTFGDKGAAFFTEAREVLAD
ncbi:hypothetical protein Amsp01_080870 [Amycolatopsis sp. NBRC 101858]|uniref:hypothetical protein n=1 Tax=Amycolatopsis sp. NBRC 101858 TaxID=3032200 RepID=UPI0024A25ED2|nr:hypothetical protein [Amycolatopsis sp. NBRC 101858]GLY42064.1 hypothetical protein Amsp01_080870 [Amycolatopsis sp. NBRC 101858]